MSLPLPFLAGLLVVVGHREFGGALPGQGVVDELAWALCLLVAPWALAAAARAAALRSLLSGRRPAAPMSAMLRLSAIATPLALHALFELGCYSDWIDRAAPSSHALRAVLALLPLYVAELPRLAVATMAAALVEARFESRAALRVSSVYLPSWRDVWPSVRLQFGWPLLALMPALLYGAGMDLLELWRDGYVFVVATAAGMSLAAMGYLLAVAALLPFWFRVAFAVSDRLPESHADSLRATAEQLGFSPRRLFVLPTGSRAVNAMMVGPLPFGRMLCFTDGILEMLDPRSLAGVLAHEVGHARMGHPGLLALLGLVVPAMLLSPLRLLDVEGDDVVTALLVMAVVMTTLWLALRALARRFEHEADVSTLQVLGAEPCSRALITVSQSTLPVGGFFRSRVLSLHPEERARLETMRRYEVEPEFRARFDRGSANLRRALAAVLMTSIAVGAWFWSVDWPNERVAVQFYRGDFAAARRSLDAIESVPERWREPLQRIRSQLDTADELQPGLERWRDVQRALVPAAWRRGEEVLIQDGPAAAYPWLALAVTAMPAPTTTEYAIYEYAKAAAERDPDRMAALARIVWRLGVPASLAEVFGGYQ
ncbi:MAG: M48 family metalloprotease [Planctomycetota bacterium]|nr:M48 family metalloprotease [Planctomycetota bacterium]